MALVYRVGTSRPHFLRSSGVKLYECQSHRMCFAHRECGLCGFWILQLWREREREREREIICERKLIIKKKKKNCERKLPPAQMIIT